MIYSCSPRQSYNILLFHIRRSTSALHILRRTFLLIIICRRRVIRSLFLLVLTNNKNLYLKQHPLSKPFLYSMYDPSNGEFTHATLDPDLHKNGTWKCWTKMLTKKQWFTNVASLGKPSRWGSISTTSIG